MHKFKTKSMSKSYCNKIYQIFTKHSDDVRYSIITRLWVDFTIVSARLIIKYTYLDLKKTTT